MGKLPLAILAAALCGGYGAAAFLPPSGDRNVAAPRPQIAYNYCTLSYTMAFWGRDEWAAEIDRLATDGFNMALVMAGNADVWRLTLREFGWPDDAIERFIPPETLQAWWNMANLTGDPESLGLVISQDLQNSSQNQQNGRHSVDSFQDSVNPVKSGLVFLPRFIAGRMRERGIEPILQAYTGMLPLDAAEHLTGPDWRIIPQGKWCVYERPPLLDPTCPGFARFAAAWYRNLAKVYGIEPKFLAGDLFHEGGNTDGIDQTAAARAVQAAQQRAFPGATWIIQMWQANPTREVLAGVDPKHTLIEALVKDMRNAGSEDFSERCALVPWVWCEVLNFGGNHGMYGGLRKLAALESKPCGWGMLSEGLETNPIFYDLFRDVRAGRKIDFDRWLADWVARRYLNLTHAEAQRGRVRRDLISQDLQNLCLNEQNQKPCHSVDLLQDSVNPVKSGLCGLAASASLREKDDACLEAWRLLTRPGGVYDATRCQEGSAENIMCAFPSAAPRNVSAWATREGPHYPPTDTLRAAELLLRAAEDESALLENPDFRYDLCDVTRQALADRAWALVHSEPGFPDTPAAQAKFMRLLELTDDLLACVDAFRLDFQESRRNGHVPEYRTMITIWTSPAFGRNQLCDYAHRNLSGLFRHYYAPRWRWFFQMRRGETDESEFARRTAALDREFPYATLPPPPKGDLLAAVRAALQESSDFTGLTESVAN